MKAQITKFLLSIIKMKTYFSKIAIFCLLVFFQVANGQQLKIPFLPKSNGIGGQVIDSLYITISAGNVTNTGSFTSLFANITRNYLGGIFINYPPQTVQNIFDNIPLAKQLKAKAGEPFNLTFTFKLHNDINSNLEPKIESYFNYTVPSGNGSFQGFKYQENGTNPPDGVYQTMNFVSAQNEYSNNCPVKNVITFTSPVTFPIGSFKGWLIFNFVVWDFISGTPEPRTYQVILPYVVEGSLVTISQATPVQIKGYINEPAIPQMILHNPPGDLSSVTFQTLQETCRKMSEALTTDISNTGRLNLTLGIAGSAGLFVSTNFEFSVTASLSGGGGSTVMKSNGTQNCVSILNSISTAPGFARANEGSIYLGYSTRLAYGLFPTVAIQTSPTLAVVRDSSVIFGSVPGSATPFYYTKK
jgi:hypothetical protein